MGSTRRLGWAPMRKREQGSKSKHETMELIAVSAEALHLAQECGTGVARSLRLSPDVNIHIVELLA